METGANGTHGYRQHPPPTIKYHLVELQSQAPSPPFHVTWECRALSRGFMNHGGQSQSALELICLKDEEGQTAGSVGTWDTQHRASPVFGKALCGSGLP